MSALADGDVVVRPRWARLKRCRVRGLTLLLVPERVLYPCPITLEVLKRIAEPRRFGDLVADLAAEYDAPGDVIAGDVSEILGGLVEDGYVRRLDARPA